MVWCIGGAEAHFPVHLIIFYVRFMIMHWEYEEPKAGQGGAFITIAIDRIRKTLLYLYFSPISPSSVATPSEVLHCEPKDIMIFIASIYYRKMINVNDGLSLAAMSPSCI